MKKLLGVVFALLFLVSPMVLRAAEKEKVNISKYNTLNLKQTLAEEEIAEEFTNYAESDDQITIYLFRGKGCGYCRAFLSFLNTITNEYGQYFKLVSFETWYDENNSNLLATISDFMGERAGGVPYIIIGDQVFPGYANTYDDSIKSAITTLYDSKERYDVFEEYNKAIDAEKRAANAGVIKSIVWNFVFISLATVVVCYYVNRSNKELYERLTNTKPVKAVVKEETVEVEETVKRPVARKTQVKKTTKKANAKTKKK
ncbi:MAG: hypothetical protein IKR57_06145 [Bacilli bacterium]|nr:hypothetical protein [Bacilli bacterium]